MSNSYYSKVFKQKVIYFLLIFIISSSLSSCGIIMKKISGLPNPEVYANTDIQSFIDVLPSYDNVYDGHFKTRLDSTQIISTMFKGIESKAFIFDKDGFFLCTNQDVMNCSYSQLNDIKETSISENYQRCEKGIHVTDEIYKKADILLKDLYFKDNKSLKTDFEGYSIIYYWSESFDKGKSVEFWNEFYSNFENEEKVRFIRINTDLNADWGLQEGKKIKLRLKKRRSSTEYDVTTSKIPYSS